MAKLPLTPDDQDSVDAALEKVENAQARLSAAQAAVTTRQADLDAILAKTRTLLVKIGLTGVPATLTELHQGRYDDQSKEPQLYANERIPTTLPKRP